MLKVLSGNKAAAYAAKLARIEVAAVYPITPQSQIGEDVSKFVADGELDCSIIEVEGEHSVMSAITGAAVAGSRVFTATSSLGLAYMTEPMMFAAGMRVPMVMVDVTRETSAQRGIRHQSPGRRIYKRQRLVGDRPQQCTGAAGQHTDGVQALRGCGCVAARAAGE